jgi:hypothetical protein
MSILMQISNFFKTIQFATVGEKTMIATLSHLKVHPSKPQNPHGMKRTDKESENRLTAYKRIKHTQAKNQNVTGQ